VVRLLPDGTRDAGYGDDGEVVLAEFASAIGVAAQSGGRAVVAVVEHDLRFDPRPRTLLLRLDPTGAPDPSFGDDGYVDVRTHLPSGFELRGLASDGDDRLVLLARTTHGGFESVLLRLDPSGDLDPSFASAGLRWLEVEGRTLSVSAAGASLVSSWLPNALRRFDATGAADATFGSGGTLLVDEAA